MRPHGYIGTPSFLKILVEKAAETGTDIRSLSKGMVGGEAFPPSLRDWLTARGIAVYQSYATADAGLIAYETTAREGLVLDEAILLESCVRAPATCCPTGRWARWWSPC